MITFDDVVKVYPGGSTAVDHLSVELPTGKLTALVGPSGCGKTTSLRMINRMVGPTSGRVLIDGQDIATQDEATLRRGIGYVIQSAGLFPHRTVLDNVATVPVLLGKSRKEARTAALGLLERVGLAPEFAKRYPAQLSGGQQQRVGVARALAADPPIMLMDEPFSAVDPVVRGQLHAEFLRLQQDLGKTIALVTHDIDEAIKLGDRVAVFRQGGILAQFGTPQELLEKPADDFVAEFVGRDRGLRSLSFDSAAALPVRPVAEEPSLLLDDAGRPVGWKDAGDLGGVFRVTDSLRVVTDLAITSPVGIAVRVDDSGRADGVVRHHDLVDHLLERRR
ncbi:ATP-binding cassette domain-containing protein [Actinoplanes missouriensis]|uniref:ABC transporter ATP-binding protein n=1 Tax=Actinoplanes missouriensis TaxID=1866 RepID=UPI00340486B8